MDKEQRDAHVVLRGVPPDPEQMNDERAKWAWWVGLEAFAKETGLSTDGEEHNEIIGDMLCNIAHWCDRNGVDFEERLGHATEMYGDETNAR